jgi:proteasome lid subunit RPN8/RPN11
MPNHEREQPRVRYVIDPLEQLRADDEARAAGLEIAGYYHSHPDHPARPSETDRRIAAGGLSDGVLHVVVGVQGGRETTPSAWIFRDAGEQFEAETFEID